MRLVLLVRLTVPRKNRVETRQRASKTTAYINEFVRAAVWTQLVIEDTVSQCTRTVYSTARVCTWMPDAASAAATRWSRRAIRVTRRRTARRRSAAFFLKAAAVLAEVGLRQTVDWCRRHGARSPDVASELDRSPSTPLLTSSSNSPSPDRPDLRRLGLTTSGLRFFQRGDVTARRGRAVDGKGGGVGAAGRITDRPVD